MSDGGAPAAPPGRGNGVLWGVLALLLLFGAVGLATFVYGLLGALDGSLIAGLVSGFGAVVAFLAFLFMLGVLYRVDRRRGAAQRRVRLFE